MHIQYYHLQLPGRPVIDPAMSAYLKALYV
jgi:hypothetical protein